MAAEQHSDSTPVPRIGASYALAGNVGRLLISAVGAIVIAALVGPAYKGALATLTAVSWIVAVVLSLGMDGANRYYLATKKWSLAQSNVVILGLTGVASVVAFIAYESVRAVAPSGILADLSSAELTAATAAVLLGIFANSSLAALREFSVFAKLAMVSALANPLFFFALRLAGVGLLPSALWGYIGGQAAMSIPAELFLIRKGGWGFARPRDAKGATWYGVRSFGTHIFNLANLRLDVLILRSLSTSSATGAYSLSTQLSEAVWLVPTSVGAAVFPEVAEGGHDTGGWTARVCRLVGALSTMMALVAGCAATLLIAVALPAYRTGILALWLLLPGTVAASASQILTQDLNARRRPHASLTGAAGALAVTVIGDVLLIPVLGLNGAALVSSVAYTVNTVILVGFFIGATHSRTAALVPRLADASEAVRLTLRTAREFLGPRPATEDV